MGAEEERPQTFVERVLVLLEERFPWLGSGQDEPVSGADTVDELSDVYRSLIQKREKARRRRRWSRDVTRNDELKREWNGSLRPICGGDMRNVQMIRQEPGLVSIPIGKGGLLRQLPDGFDLGPAAMRSLRVGSNR